MPKTTIALPGVANQTQGDILYFNASGVLTRLPAGTSGQFLQTLGAGNNPAWETVPFVNSYISSAQTITAAGALTLAHGLGAIPTLVTSFLECQTSEGNYSQGDLVYVPGGSTSGSSQGVSIIPDATNLNVRFGLSANTFSLLNKTTGGVFDITNANWKIIFSAWAP